MFISRLRFNKTSLGTICRTTWWETKQLYPMCQAFLPSRCGTLQPCFSAGWFMDFPTSVFRGRLAGRKRNEGWRLRWFVHCLAADGERKDLQGRGTLNFLISLRQWRVLVILDVWGESYMRFLTTWLILYEQLEPICPILLQLFMNYLNNLCSI